MPDEPSSLPPGEDLLLRRYADLVRRWAPRLDLLSEGDLPRFWERHVLDGLRLRPLLATLGPGDAIDVGSGVGVPGIPLAIVEPARHWRLLEPRRRRAAFLEEAIRTLGLDCEVLLMTAENAGRDPALAGAHRLAVARALAPPERAFPALVPLLAPGGVAAVFVGEEARLPEQAMVWREGIAILRP